MASNFAGEVFIFPPSAPETRGRKRRYHRDRAATSAETMQTFRAHERVDKVSRIAVLDFETDPFDSVNETPVFPFTFCLLSDDFEPIVRWNNNLIALIDELFEIIEGLETPYIIYAHNGGKFDFMFLLYRLRGKVSFKGRGLMDAKIGKHTLRDSTHILPMKLSEWKKDDFDYSKMKKSAREKHRAEIIEYMTNDCRSLLSIVKAFVTEFGFKLSVGQAAMSELKKKHTFVRLGDHTDAELRPWFFGGRVECLDGAGHFVAKDKGLKLIDVNSMYPWAMASFQHPVGGHFVFRKHGGITPKTIFLKVYCRNHGALIRRTEFGETTANVERGLFFTTIWEFRKALELGLIDDVQIQECVDCDRFDNFAAYVVPMYERRQETKRMLRELKGAGYKEDSPEYLHVKKEDMFLKFLLNTGYGKFAQNPRRFKNAYITEHGLRPPIEAGFDDIPVPSLRNEGLNYDIWEKPAPQRGFYNVSTAASITGAARATLLHAIHHAEQPIYCDTDSLICRGYSNIEIDKTKLGAWDLEAEFDEVIVVGKKTYACRTYSNTTGQPDGIRVRSKGAPLPGVNELGSGSMESWQAMQDLLAGKTLTLPARGPTITKAGTQHYLKRNIRATAQINGALAWPHAV